jgi:hypothetical protein
VRDFLELDKVPPPESRMQKDRAYECGYCEVRDKCDFIMSKRQEIKEKNADTWIDLELLYPEEFQIEENNS